MKARIIAVLLSFFVVSLPVQAESVPKKTTPVKATPVEQAPTVSNKIDLNKADVNTLTGSFKGIGKKRAEAIIAYRDSHSGFKSIEEFAEIKGFGQHFVEVNREKLAEVFVVK